MWAQISSEAAEVGAAEAAKVAVDEAAAVAAALEVAASATQGVQVKAEAEAEVVMAAARPLRTLFSIEWATWESHCYTKTW